jgi:cyclic-di-GMP-binding protein
MPSFDIVSEIDKNEVKNAVNQFRKELLNRFDFKGTDWDISEEPNALALRAESDFKLRAMTEILLQKLAGRNVSLKNVQPEDPEISSVGRARQVFLLKEGLDSDIARKVVAAIKELKLKVQPHIEGPKVRVSGKKLDELQKVMAHLRHNEFPVDLSFDNFRD